MPFHLIENLKSKASHMAYNSFFYDWSLREDTPDRLVVKPVDPWPGDAAKGQELLHAAGIGARTGPQWDDAWWDPSGADALWASHMHSFTWLRDLRALDGALAREQGRLMIESWIDCYNSWHAQSWRSDLIGRRLSMWICHYEFFCANASPDFEDKFIASILKQAKHLSNGLNKPKDAALLETIKGLLYSAIALSGHETWIRQALDALKSTIDAQVLPDGGHVSRSPALLLDTIEIMVDLRSALAAGAYPVPDFLSEAIDDMSAALRTLRYRDRRLGLFHGTQEGETEIIDSILAQAGTYKKAPQRLEHMGYERLEMGRSLLLLDTGKTPQTPYDKTAHASPLAFEFCYGKDRLFVSCGTHPLSAQWQDALRFTAAHNTACLDHRNACEIKKDGHFGRSVTHTTCTRHEEQDLIEINASHDGYVPLNGVLHSRKIRMEDEGNIVRGEDDFSCEKDALDTPINAALRFHIHPNVTASLVKDGTEVLLRMHGGVGWRLSSNAGLIRLEDSLYLGSGITPRKTKQIVIYGQVSGGDCCVEWQLEREG